MTARLDRWERQLRWAVEFVPYAGLAISTLLAFVIPWPTRLLGLQLAVVGAAALWMLWLVTLHPTWADNRPLMVAYFLGLLGAITTLVVLNPLYGFFAFAGYLHAVYALRGRWQLIGVAATSVAITLSQVGGVPTVRTPGGRTAFAIILPFNLCVACAMVLLARVTYDTDSDVLPAIEAGATGYLLKDAPREELFRAVRAAARGEAVLSPTVATRLMGQLRAPAKEPLSQRELEVLTLVSRGSTNRATAAQLFISEATVKTHLLHIYAKLGVRDRAAAVAAGFARGLLTQADGRLP